MRRVRYSVAMSLDAYIAGPNGESDWIVHDPDIDFGEIFSRFDTLLIGRKTFEADDLARARFVAAPMREAMVPRRSRVRSCANLLTVSLHHTLVGRISLTGIIGAGIRVGRRRVM